MMADGTAVVWWQWRSQGGGRDAPRGTLPPSTASIIILANFTRGQPRRKRPHQHEAAHASERNAYARGGGGGGGGAREA